MDIERRRLASASVDRLTELPMLALSVAMVPLILAPFLFDLSGGLEDAFFMADWAIWAVFALELSVKTYLAPTRTEYLKRHWFDVMIVVLPFLRPLRIVRSARALRALRATRLVSFVARATHSTREVLAEHGLQYVLAVGGLVVLAAAGLVTLFERDAGGSINNFGDGLWWAVTTITTVGYGDKVPVTAEGRGIAIFVMLVGITLFGLITANIAAFFVKPIQEKETATLDDVLEQLRKLEAKVEALQSAEPPQRDTSGR